MRNLFLTLCLFFSLSLFADSDDGRSAVLSMLESNTVVIAAVDQAKDFSGAEECSYTIESSPAEGFAKGTTFDYTAEINCVGETESASSIKVEGRLFSDGPQTLNLSIFFAG